MKILFQIFCSICLIGVLCFLAIDAESATISKLDSLSQTLSTKLTDKRRASTLETIAKIFIQSDLDSAEIYALKAVEVYRSLKDTNSIARSYNAAGLANYYSGNYDKTLDYWKKCLKYYELTDNKRELSRTNTNIGAVYFNQSDNVTALEYYLKAQKYAEEIQDSLRLMTVYANIASIYGVKKITTPKAIEYDLKALAIGEHIGDKGTIGTVCGNIAELYMGQHKHSLAATYFKRSLEAHRGTENEAYALIGMAKVHRSNGELQKAMGFFNQAHDKAKEFGIKIDEGDALKGIGQLYLKMNKPKLALDNLSKAFKLFSAMNHKTAMLTIASDLSEAYEKTGSYKSAYKYSTIALSLKDSVYNVEFDQKVSEQISDYKLQKKEDEITILNKEKELQTLEYQTEVEKKNRTRNAFALGGLALLIFAVGLWSRLRFVRKSRSIIEKEKERSDELLLNILPFEIAEELKEKGSADARDFDQATILFTDFKDFTTQAEQLSAQELVAEIDYCFKGFDEICSIYKIEKIKTIGDAYMAYG